MNGNLSVSLGRKLTFFLLVPITAVVLTVVGLAVAVTSYQSRHNERIFTGVSVWGVDLGGMSLEEARTALANTFPYPHEEVVTLTSPGLGHQWRMSPVDLGLSFDIEQTVTAAFAVGRSGNSSDQFSQMFESWYYGHQLAPIVVLDESQLDSAIAMMYDELYQKPTNASLFYNGETAVYTPAQTGVELDIANLRARLVEPIVDFRRAEVELLVHETLPAIYDEPTISNEIEQLLSGPVTFYLNEPLDDLDLGKIMVSQEELISWMRVDLVTRADGSRHHKVFLDENAVRHWLSQYETAIYREPVNARFYFDDDTRELVLVAPHINGRSLDIDATIARLQQQVVTPNRSVPFIMTEIVPTVHSNATASELGITELIREQTTWFRGSSDARKRNIARSAQNFFGIVIAPGEEFSFNKYLGTITEDDGYEEGLIIVGGQTIRGIGGGVCQVSTTVFQTAFWAGFPVTERWPHGYMLGYYQDGEGHGMDATVFSPIVDLKFINNTPYHLLMENYYSEENEALTMKFYSTSMGRTVEKEGPVFENVVPARPSSEDVWTFDEKLAPGTVKKVDWATEGADVTVRRIVYNADGQLIHDQSFVSNYIPIPDGFAYGPGANAGDYHLIPPEDR